MRIENTDAILVTPENYRTATKAEQQVAIELAKSLAAEIGVEPETAVACAVCLERVVTDDSTQDIASHKASAGARKQQFALKAKSLQETRNAN